MSKLQVASYISNFIVTIVAFHIIFSTWIDHTPVSFGYFYIICAGLIFNFIEALLPIRSAK